MAGTKNSLLLGLIWLNCQHQIITTLGRGKAQETFKGLDLNGARLLGKLQVKKGHATWLGPAKREECFSVLVTPL